MSFFNHRFKIFEISFKDYGRRFRNSIFFGSFLSNSFREKGKGGAFWCVCEWVDVSVWCVQKISPKQKRAKDGDEAPLQPTVIRRDAEKRKVEGDAEKAEEGQQIVTSWSVGGRMVDRRFFGGTGEEVLW